MEAKNPASLCTAEVIFQFVHENRDAAKSKTYGSQWKKQHLSKQRCLLLRVMFLPESVWTLCGFFVCILRESSCILAKVHNTVRIHSEVCQCGFLPIDPMVNSQGSKSAGCCAGIILCVWGSIWTCHFLFKPLYAGLIFYRQESVIPGNGILIKQR